ncbi:helix-turn-helix transcriptional regulator [Pseudosulfitobacter sp. DSM 107133]|uniref:helix-turn-helix transcriptional regulator n=1 Tax=Pseudosulfitobacter sp. DSM 107133 TaxID=2883100 RepID=UPI000DF32730|nr:helix-turn-helix transcriptional regulator [Pseudosulfitobacter sp. DSM 107133]UOA28460.1 Shikimate kinase 1 [Pseudosulfitobacter sp. DSM 107133]
MTDQSNTPNDNPLIQRLAQRVRDARKAQKLPRRALSDRSGVSPRYLAQLESGQGNISILLLARVADALGVPVSALLADDAPLSDDTLRVAKLFQSAGADIQGRVRAMLAPQAPGGAKAQRICLVGLRGAGKSTLGQAAAAALGIRFLELNTLIEDQAGMPVAEVMGLYGQDGYRDLEQEVLGSVIDSENRLILAVGGGIVAEQQTYRTLLERFHTVWVRTSPAEHMARVRAQGDLRPMKDNPAAMDQLKALLTARTPLYERAQAQVDTANRPVQSSVNDLLAVIAKHRFVESISV